MRQWKIKLFFLLLGSFTWQAQAIVLHQYVPNYLSNNKFTWQIGHQSNTNFTKHTTYNLFFENKKVIGAILKVNETLSNKILSLVKYLPDSLTANQITPSNMDAYYFNGIDIQPVQIKLIKNGIIDYTYLINESKEVLKFFSNAQFAKDSIIKVNVFLPDPLTTNNTIYGGSFIDNNDTNSNWLNNALTPKKVIATWDDSLFILKNNNFEMVELDIPTYPIVKSKNNSLLFNRSEAGFENTNIFYHLTFLNNYYKNLGFNILKDKVVLADAHGLNGSDNSLFIGGSTLKLIFGDGGVDDGEDADVIAHEFTHALSFIANGNELLTAEREALDEGIADYFATSYSKSISTYGNNYVYNWDGHNEFWQGRVTNTSNNYAEPFVLEKYEGGEVFNAALSILWQSIGRSITDKLVLQALYSINGYTTFKDAAYYIWQADSLFYNSAHEQDICNAFQQKNINLNNCATKTITDSNISLSNQLSFANGNGLLQIKGLLPQNNYLVKVYNLNGQAISNFKITKKIVFDYENYGLAPGVYFMNIIGNNQNKRFKFSKFR